MKRIKLIPLKIVNGEQISSVIVLRQVMAASPNRGISIDEMRKRVKVLQALADLPEGADTLVLEDEDANILKMALEGFPWSAANEVLLSIIEAALNQETLAPTTSAAN